MPLLVPLLLFAAATAPYDLVIRNGRIIDGTGSPWYAGDLAIRAGRIARIGDLSGVRARRTLDARGMVVAPGFIDMLGQSELTILVNPHLPSKIYQGITTEVTGEGGVTLRDVWRDGAHAYLGMAVPGFPNFFMLYGPNTNVGSNSVIFVLEAQARYIVRALRYLRRKGGSYVAVRPSAMANFLAKIDQWMQGTVWTTQCSNYFRAANGRVVTQWPRSTRAFWGMTRRFKSADFVFQAVGDSGVTGDALSTLDGQRR